MSCLLDILGCMLFSEGKSRNSGSGEGVVVETSEGLKEGICNWDLIYDRKINKNMKEHKKKELRIALSF